MGRNREGSARSSESTQGGVLRVAVPNRLLRWLLLSTAVWLFLMNSTALGVETYLSNGTLTLGVNLTWGGAINYLVSTAPGSPYTGNLIYDHPGADCQQSYWSGPIPYRPPGVQYWPGEHAWNACQAGDIFGNPSPVLSWSNNGSEIYVKTQPLQYFLNNYLSECYMEEWISLNGNAVNVRTRLTNFRSDHTNYGPFDQEMPAYCRGFVIELPHFMSYDGTRPFTGEAAVNLPSPPENTGYEWHATENWAAWVSDSNWGIGIFNPGVVRFLTHNIANDGYIAPLHRDIFDYNIVYDNSYSLIVGNLSDIRNYVYANKPDNRPNYVFSGNRQHWYYHNATDTGVSTTADHLHVQWDAGDDPFMLGPWSAFLASDVDQICIRAAFDLEGSDTAVFSWQKDNVATWASESFQIINDGQYHTYVLDVSSNPEWQGMISLLRFDPAEVQGGSMDIQYISWVPEPASLSLLLLGALAVLRCRGRAS